jgi:hypothetical protein
MQVSQLSTLALECYNVTIRRLTGEGELALLTVCLFGVWQELV